MIPHISARAAAQAFAVFGDPKDERRAEMPTDPPNLTIKESEKEDRE